MTTVIFVHGTGVRKSQYFETFEQIKKNLHTQHPGVKVVPCCWGEELGTKLNAQGASIPLYDTTLALEEEEEENEEILLWEQLYCNPFYELSLLSLQPVEESGANPFAEQPGDLLHSRLQSLSPNADLEAKLVEAEIVEVFDEARQVVTRSEPYNQVLLMAVMTKSSKSGNGTRRNINASTHCQDGLTDYGQLPLVLMAKPLLMVVMTVVLLTSP